MRPDRVFSSRSILLITFHRCWRLVLGGLFLYLFAAACGGGDAALGPTSYNLSGLWYFEETFADNAVGLTCSDTGRLVVTQSGPTFSAAGFQEGMCSGPGGTVPVADSFRMVNGRIDGARISFRVDPCPYSGTAIGAAPDSVAGSIDCRVSIEDVSLHLQGTWRMRRPLPPPPPPIIALLDLSPLDLTTGNFQSPGVAFNDQGMILVVYDKDRALISKFSDGSTTPPAWQTPGIGAANYWPAAPDHQLVMNASGAAGLVYKVSSDQLNEDRNRFGFAYFDGAAWRYNQTLEGAIQHPFSVGDIRTPIVGIDNNGTAYVAFKKVANGAPIDVLVLARFTVAGLLDTTEFSEPVGNLYLSVSASGQVMVLNTGAGSRTFDGTSWSPLKPVTVPGEGPAFLALSSSGSAEVVTLYNAITHYHYDGASWGPGVRINGSFSAGNGAAAVDGAGNIMVAYMGPSGGPEYHIQANLYDGTSWGPPKDVDNTAEYEANPALLVDGIGNFVALYGSYANYFAGASWHTPTVLEGQPGVLYPAVAMKDDGDFVVISPAGGGLYSFLYTFSP